MKDDLHWADEATVDLITRVTVLDPYFYTPSAALAPAAEGSAAAKSVAPSTADRSLDR